LGAAPAASHAAHISHIRPLIKDICWQHKCVIFPDFEPFAAKPHQEGRPLMHAAFGAAK